MIIASCFCDNITKRSVETVAIIADGGTNSGTALANGKVMYSSGGAIVENSLLRTTGGNLNIVTSGVSVTPALSGILTLTGSNAHSTLGPHITAYTSADNYPVVEHFNYGHNNGAICWDCYFDGSWRSSSSSLNFMMYKLSTEFRLQYATGISQGT
jgi:hypothetical protein